MSKKLPALAALTIATTASGLVAAAEDWAGFYGGAGGGYGSSNTQFSSLDSNSVTVDGGEGVGLVTTTTTTTASVSQDGGGVLGGLNLGYNFQSGDWVFGAEVNGSLFDGEEAVIFPGAVGTNQLVVDVDNVISFQGRVGFARDKWLIFGTGGATLTRMQYNLMTGSGLTTSFENETGWVAGGGIEYRITENLSVQLMVTHADIGAQSATVSDADSTITLDTDADMTIGKLGINFHF